MRLLPTKEQLRRNRALGMIGKQVLAPDLWHMKRRPVSRAVFIGLFCCFLPIPFQMFPCALLCIWARANLPVGVALVWISNPITMLPLLYAAYLAGCWLLDRPPQIEKFEPEFAWWLDTIHGIWQPLLLGCLVCGTTLGMLGFLLVRLIWRYRTIRRRRQRQQQRQQHAADEPDH